MPEPHAADRGRATLRLLGGWQLLVGGVDVPLRHREQRLTALLGLTGRGARAHVAGTLWPDTTDARALASLRRAVLQVRQRSPGLLVVDRTHIRLGPDVEVDVDAVRRAARSMDLPTPGADALLAALVGEPLLPAWYDDWVLPEREHIEQLRVRALERIARHAFATGDLVRAVDAARAALDIDPLLESARELTIRAHLGQGDRGSALREFHRHRDAMRDELEVAPSTAIRALVEPVLTDAGAGSGAQEGEAGAGPTPGPAAAVSQPLRMEDLHVPITPVPQAAIPRPDRVPPESAGPAGPVLPAPPTPVEADVPGGRRGRMALLLAVGVLVLVASLAVAGVGAGRGDPDLTGGALSPDSAPAPAPDVRAGSGTGDVPTRPRQVMVRPAQAASGSAALLVRATRRPASVRVVMRGPEGRVLRRVVVRSEDGRRLVLGGLDPGTYRWLVTSPSAAPVIGRVTVAEEPVVTAPPPQTTTPVATPVTIPVTPPPGPTSQPAPSTSAQQAGPAPQPSPTTPSTQEPTSPTTTPTTQQPTPQPASAPAPQPTRQPTPSQQPSPAEDPTDPGTLEPTPVG